MSSIASIMKCILYGSRDSSRLPPQPVLDEKHSIPRLHTSDNHHVLVRVHYAGLNPVDAKDIMGDKLPHSWTTLRGWVHRYISNKIPGFDFSGTVVAAHDDNTFNVGDRVYGTMPPFQGTCAEYILAPVDQVARMPRNYSFAQAAALPLVGLTALQCMGPHINKQEQNRILVLGASGGTGHVAVQVARCLDPQATITAVCSSKHEAFVKTLGANHVVDYHDSDFLQQLEENQQASPFTFVMDCVTSADPRDTAIHYPTLLQQQQQQQDRSSLLAENYVYRRLGGPSPDWIRAGLQRTICSKSSGRMLWPNPHEQLFWIKFPQSAPELQQLTEWAEEGKIIPHISQVHDMTADGVKQAFETILSRRVQGKVIIRVLEDADS